MNKGLRHWIPDRLEGTALESMTVAADGVTWNLKVRPEVRFPSGQDVDAEAVKRVFDRNFGVKGRPAPSSIEAWDVSPVRKRWRSSLETPCGSRRIARARCCPAFSLCRTPDP